MCVCCDDTDEVDDPDPEDEGDGDDNPMERTKVQEL